MLLHTILGCHGVAFACPVDLNVGRGLPLLFATSGWGLVLVFVSGDGAWMVDFIVG